MVFLLLQRADCFSSYVSRVPNGALVSYQGNPVAGLGHLNIGGGGPRNPFGIAFAAGNNEWSAICNLDSDGDGFSNGDELGADCSWSSSNPIVLRTTGLSHPGFADSMPPAPATPIPATPVPDTPAPATPIPATPVPDTPVPATPIPPRKVHRLKPC